MGRRVTGPLAGLAIGTSHQARLDTYYHGPRDTTMSHTGANEPDAYSTQKGRNNELKPYGPTYEDMSDRTSKVEEEEEDA